MATNKIRLSMLTEADLVALLGILNDVSAGEIVKPPIGS